MSLMNTTPSDHHTTATEYFGIISKLINFIPLPPSVQILRAAKVKIFNRTCGTNLKSHERRYMFLFLMCKKQQETGQTKFSDINNYVFQLTPPLFKADRRSPHTLRPLTSKSPSENFKEFSSFSTSPRSDGWTSNRTIKCSMSL